ncbi:carboxypeptidase-like regulatory domain-containing protein [Pedobacter sp. AW1-32]|uniref:carboxypeptidase-like regulatory domain-containing protein n=1 Tax=Pedobacter sp. AW1-32 TaxID=3383026 RepID=UPI003FF088A4
MYRLLLILFIAIPGFAFGQSVTTGSVFDYSKKNLPLPSVAVRNLSTKKATITSTDGKYSIAANIGDLIEFSLVGYQTDTLYLSDLSKKTIYLPERTNSLGEVNVEAVKMSKGITNAADPLAEKYTRVTTGGNLERKRMNDKVGSLGLNLGYGKYKKQQRKEAALEQKEAYMQEVDANFTEKAVTDLTKLNGTELKNFMILYRPTAEQVMAERPFSYPYYISKSFTAWQKLTPEQKTLKDLPNLKTN